MNTAEYLAAHFPFPQRHFYRAHLGLGAGILSGGPQPVVEGCLPLNRDAAAPTGVEPGDPVTLLDILQEVVARLLI